MAGPLGATQWMYDVAGFYPTVLEDSLKFNNDESQYLSWTPAAAGNRKTWTWSAWVKRSSIGSNQYLFQARIDDSSTEGNKVTFYFLSDNTIRVLNQTTVWKQTSAAFRDTSAWYHILLAVDTTNSTTNNRVRIYINGEEASYSTNAGPSLNADLAVNSTNPHYIGQEHGGYSYFDGYLSDIHFIDGQALDPTSFGELKDSIWIPSRYNGTYGTNGFHLEFKNDDTVEGFNAVTYEGTGSSTANYISGIGFAPNLVWIKNRDATADHALYDSLRTNMLSTNSTAAEVASSGVVALNADGFGIGSADARVNSAASFVAWCWDAGSGSAVSNTDGSITSTVKANPDYGFSIASYTGNNGSSGSFGHGLSVAPNMVIIKSRTDVANWAVGHDGLTSWSYYIPLNSTSVQVNDSANFNGTAPTSTVVNIGGSGNTNDAENYIAYCFHSVSGYSSFGSYSGSGAAGNAVTGLGFKPAFLMIKGIDVAEHWMMYDNTRNPANPVDDYLLANGSGVEATNQTTRSIDFDADGFTVDGTGTEVNQSGKNYLYMAFADTRDAAFWRDTSGNNNNWTPNNLDYRDSLIDVPTNNFATLNPLDNYNTGATLSEGNLKWTIGAADGASRSTHVMTAGKWYVEFLSNNDYIGVVSGNASIVDMTGTQTVYYAQDGTKRVNGSFSSYGASYANGDIIGIALDLDASPQTVNFYKNNAAQGSLNLTDVGNEGYSVSCGSGSGSTNATANFGQDSTFAGATIAGGNQDDNGVGNFKYSVPSGYLALCTSNLPTPTIIDGSEHFNAVTYTGTGTTNPVIVGFSPDFTWIKQRNTTRDHQLLDIVRGYTNNIIYTNLTNAEDVSVTARIDSRYADGFTVITPTQVNQSGGTYAAWNWKAGGTAVSNTDGSITSSVSANTDAGFSIVSYTGTGSNQQSIGHGLTSSPDMVIIKDRNNADNWYVYHTGTSIPYNRYLQLNSTAAEAASTAFFWDSGNTSTFGLSNSGSVTYTNQNGVSYIAYCFANTDGYLKAGSYIGNGSSDGTFVYTGFRPAWLMVKRTNAAGGWHMFDNKRAFAGNEIDVRLEADNSDAENTSGPPHMDFLSNGFKMRTSFDNMNASGSTYIYLAFAENPFKHSNAR